MIEPAINSRTDNPPNRSAEGFDREIESVIRLIAFLSPFKYARPATGAAKAKIPAKGRKNPIPEKEKIKATSAHLPTDIPARKE